MFMIDATASMADELECLKAEVADVIESVGTTRSGLHIRTSVNFYRDEGDQYVVRSFPFTTSLTTVTSQIAAQTAGGGGDYPEAVHLALQNAVSGHQWSSSARARLLFLVLDAPPHEQQGVIASIGEQVERAARSGIRIVPVASSGVNTETEFILRAIDILTGGTADEPRIGRSHRPGNTRGYGYMAELCTGS